jgi:hypothetical protein
MGSAQQDRQDHGSGTSETTNAMTTPFITTVAPWRTPLEALLEPVEPKPAMRVQWQLAQGCMSWTRHQIIGHQITGW